MNFLAREPELEVLRKAYEDGQGALIPIYGRRRIGKSSLILQFLKEHSGIYYLGKQAPAELQQREFLRTAGLVLKEPLLGDVAPQDWRHVFQLVTDRLELGGRWVLALDEFQWMVQQSPELSSLLQEFWDMSWSKNPNAMVILCGSYIGFMEREVLGHRSPLFGRRTAQIHLRPFDFRESALFHPDISHPNHAKTYFICGGVPQYLIRFKAERSVEENIRQEILEEFAPLYREPEFLLREELRELPNYYAILMVLARGSSSIPDIAKGSAIPERSIPYYLKQLVELGYVRKRYPLIEDKPSARHVRFQLADPLLRFWFRFVFPQESQIRRLGSGIAFSQLIKPKLAAYFGLCFEELCREALAKNYIERQIFDFEIGEYWDKNVQIDLVGLRTDGVTDLGECKWGRVTSLKNAQQELERKARLYPNSRNATIMKNLFVTESKGRVPEGLILHSLDSLYGES